LVRNIHEHIFKKAPPEFLPTFTKRILDGAARADIPQKNRQALYDTADILESKARTPASASAKKKPPQKKSAVASPQVPPATSSPPPAPSALLSKLELPAAALAEKEVKKKGKKRKAKTNGSGNACMSPLVLPEAALPTDAPTPKKQLKKKKRGAKQGSQEGVASEAKAAGSPSKKALPESAAAKGKKRKKRQSPKVAPKALAPPHVSFDLKSTEVMKYRKTNPVASKKSSSGASEPGGKSERVGVLKRSE